LVWLEHPLGAISKQRRITFLFYIHIHFLTSPRERAEQAWFAKGCLTGQASWICTLGSIARASGRAQSGWNASRSLKVNKEISYFYFM
jgi:hypothetical protein